MVKLQFLFGKERISSPPEDFDAFFLLCTRRATPNDLPQLRRGKGGGVTGVRVIPRKERKEVKRLGEKSG